MHELLQDTPENRSHGFVSVGPNCPQWAQERIVAMRQAQLDGVEFRMSTQQIAEAQQRCLAAGTFEQRLFPPTVRTRRLPALPPGVSFEDVLALQVSNEVRALRARLKQQADVIAADRRAAQQRAEQEQDIREMRRSLFPWES